MVTRIVDAPADLERFLAGIEVACNLISNEEHQPKPEEVKARAIQLATEQSIPVGDGYRIGKSLQELVEEATEQLPEEG